MQVYYDKDTNLDMLRQRIVAIIGFGSQGHAHAQNLKDSGMQVVVGLRPGGSSWNKAQQAGMDVRSVADAAAAADVVMMLVPDELQGQIYTEDVAPNMKAGAALAFSHGFNIHFHQIQPPTDIAVFMVAPKGPGHMVRHEFTRDCGVPCLIAIHQDPTGNTKDLALAYAAGIGGGRAGIIETSFQEETETDLFGEQAVLCGGVTALAQAGFETLVEAGYAPEMAYFECIHELKLIVDLIYEGGIANMRYSISNTAEYGDLTRGPRVVNADAKAQMKQVLEEIQSGKFAREWLQENQTRQTVLKTERQRTQAHQCEEVGKKLRGMMPWIGQNRIVDQDKN